nr:hypothetical protein [Aquisphaera giovannonii]
MGHACAVLRARSGSLWPAIACHVIGNLAGVPGAILGVALHRVPYGRPPEMLTAGGRPAGGGEAVRASARCVPRQRDGAAVATSIAVAASTADEAAATTPVLANAWPSSRTCPSPGRPWR